MFAYFILTVDKSTLLGIITMERVGWDFPPLFVGYDAQGHNR